MCSVYTNFTFAKIYKRLQKLTRRGLLFWFVFVQNNLDGFIKNILQPLGADVKKHAYLKTLPSDFLQNIQDTLHT